MLGNIVLVGVGGSGLSSIAYLFENLGYTDIVGIDSNRSQITDILSSKGIKIYIGHGLYTVSQYDLVIYSDIPSIINGPEVSQAMQFAQDFRPKNYQKSFSYNEFLAELSKLFMTIAISGNKGKTTTTSMAIHTMSTLVGDFGIGIVGAMVPSRDGQNFKLNTKQKTEIKKLVDHIVEGKGVMDWSLVKKFYFVIEACEYKDHFLGLDTDRAIITNIVRDHPDYFKTESQYFKSFVTFAQKAKKGVFCDQKVFDIVKLDSDIDSIDKFHIVTKSNFEFINLIGKYQDDNGSLVLEFLKYISTDENNSPRSQSLEKKLKYDFFGLFVKMCQSIFCKKNKNIKSVIESSPAIRRRMENIGQTQNGAMIFSDYGHNTMSLKSGIEAIATKFPDKKLLLIFQPHQAGRIVQSRHDMTSILSSVENLVIYDLYTARESLSDFDLTFLDDRLQKTQNIKKNIGPKSRLPSFEDIFDSQDIDHIGSFADLGKKFAHDSAGVYIDDFDIIEQMLDSVDSSFVVLIMTAGDLDYKVRNIYGISIQSA